MDQKWEVYWVCILVSSLASHLVDKKEVMLVARRGDSAVYEWDVTRTVRLGLMRALMMVDVTGTLMAWTLVRPIFVVSASELAVSLDA